MTELKISNSFHELLFDTALGARAISWKLDGTEILAIPTAANLFGGNYVMAPWAGRIKGAAVDFNGARYPQLINHSPWAIHGSTPFHPPTIIEQTESRVIFEHNLDNELPTWPKGFTVVHSWELKESELITEIFVKSSETEFPAVVGWHPWFVRTLANGDVGSYGVSATHVFEVDDSKIVTGELGKIEAGPWDCAFLAPTGKAFIEWGNSFRIEINTNSEFFVVYDEPDDFVCIEPQSGPPNGSNLNSPEFNYVVTPTNPLVLSATWKVSKPS